MRESSTLTAEKTPQNRRRQLEAWLRKKAEQARRFPLSFSQQRLWLLDQLEPGNPVYNIPLALWLSGPLDIDALQQTVNEIVARHESLRTKIVVTDDQPMQVVEKSKPQKLTVIDLEHIEPAERETEAVAWAKTEARQPFCLADGPLYRASLLRFSATEHVLVVVLHHIISDDWSVAVLFREVAVLYPAFKAGLPSPLEPLPIQYADYAVWQRERLQGEPLRLLLDYWCSRLRDVPPLDLPTDQPRSFETQQAGGTETLRLPPVLADRLRELARREGATLYMILLAAFQTLLHRYSGQEDFAIGSPIAGRIGKETEGLVGFFVNTLVLRADLAGAPTFRGLLGRVRQTALEAFQHQELPFERLVEALNPDRDAGRHPLFQVMLTLQNAPWPVVNLAQLSFTPLPINTGTAKFELSFTAREDREGLLVSAEYRTCLFEPATIQRMLQHFENLLESIVADPDQLVSKLALLDEAERQVLLVDRNATRRDYPPDMLLPQLFEAQARRTPDAGAVVFEDQQLTYRELDERANRLAHRLRTLGVGPDVLVGIYLERSLELVVGLLGVLKAGGAYVPVDSSYPADRVEFMLGDGPVPLVLTQQRLAKSLPSYPGQVLAIDGEEDAAGDGTAVKCPATPDDTAYVLYTSGSTGKPKGVVITHRAICNHMLWMAEEYPLEPSDALLQKTPISFDPSVWEFYAPLMAGARLVMAQPYGHMDPRYLTRVIQQQQITILRVVPTLLQMLVSEPSFAQCTSLRRVLVGGEALPAELVRRTAAVIEAEICNMYGPTEAAIVATSFRWDGRASGTTVPIGRPMANAEAYVLGAARQLMPIGVPGELYLGGAGLARGYLNRPELTAERFVPHPFRSDPESRLYRTGDLVRWLPDGNLEFLGRLDHQVKIRGNRIELGEIQSVLSNHPAVLKAVVTAFDNGSGGKELAAYWVAKDAPPPVDQLRDFLRKSLPEYMIPSVFVALDSIPLMPNGKVDTKALPRPTHQRDKQRPYVPPRTPDEELLAEIWREVLHVDQVGVHDNFFALGGHSLLATQVMSRITRGLHFELPLRELFQTPTIAELAERLAVLRSQGQAPCGEPVPVAPRDEPLPASFAQEALWVLDRLDPGSAVYNVPLAVRVTGPLDTDALTRTLHEVVARHESLRTKMAMHDGRLIQVIQAVSSQELAIVDLQDLPSAERESQVASRAAAEARRPFHLEEGPLFRASLLRLSPTEHVLVLAMHHIISDDWSMGVLFSDIVALYQAFMAGRPSPLNPLTIQYADYAAWQRQRLQGEHLQSLLDYWCPRLLGVAPLELPTDRPRSRESSSAGATIETHLPSALTAQLKELGRGEGATLYMTLLAAFQVLLHRYSGQEDFAVGSPIANRLRPEIESLIGYLINVVVLRASLAGDPTFRGLLEHVKQTSLEAFEHQELPFERLVEALNPARDAGRHPLFQVLFTLQNAPRPRVKLANLAFSVLPLDTDTSKFELSFTAWEEDDRLALSVEYDSHLFRPDTIQRMVRNFQTLLEGIVADADRPLSRLPLVGKQEQRQLLDQWNDTACEFDRGRCVQQLFEMHAEQRPEAMAVVGDERAWTYGELNRRANQLARYLQRQGVEPEVRVGICLERSPELVLAVLGVLKAGGAYVPLDVAYTQDARERTRFVLQDAQVSLVLTQSDLAASLDKCGAQRLLLDGEAAQQIGAERGDNVAAGAGAEQLAYVLYTSGSTGRPKGVMVTHGNLLNAYYGWEQAYRLGSEVRAHLQMASFGFDVFAGDLVRALGSGGKLVICPKEVLLDPAELLQLMRQEQVDGAEFVPVVLRTLVQHLEQTDQSLDFMRLVVVGSDAWFVGDHQRTRRLLGPQTRLINSYGLTETTIDSSYFEGEAEASLSGLVPIGRPFPNVRLYVLDAGRQPVPIGVPGELYIGGQGVARGYVNAELNRARFVADPFVRDMGARLCRTGDRARWRADGQMEFLGRADDQVKIRGFRIEPGEVEQVLREHPLLAEAAVAVRERSPGDPQLVAYTAAREGEAPSVAELRQFLRQRLPDYMIPGMFVSLSALPVTSSGKVDRRALPTPDWSVVQRDGEYVAPRTEDEKQLARIWQEVLHVDQAGVHDNFFVMGGHSLLATQVVSRVAREFHIDLPLRDVFLTPTIAEMAQRVATIRSQGKAFCGDPIPVASRDGDLPPSFAQESLWVLDQLDPGSPAYNIPLALRLSGALDVDTLNRALQEVVTRHESLRTKIAVRDGRPVQVIEAARPQGLAIVDLQSLAPAEREAEAVARAAAEARRPFRLDEAPLFRALLLRLSPTEHVLVLVMHHIISDDWSMGVLFADVVSVYQAFAAGRPSPLSDLAIQYADYAAWQRQRLQGENLQRLYDYWCPRLQDVSPLDLPFDQPRSLQASQAGATYDVRLPSALAEQLLEAGRREGATLYMTLLAAFQVLLYRYSGQEDFAVGSPIANRLRPEIEPLIGYFINVVVQRTNLAGDPTFRHLLGHVRQATLEALEHQELPFERLVEALNPARDTLRHPLFQVMFSLENAPSPDMKSAGIDVSVIPLATDTSKFDLTFTAREEPDGLLISVEYNSQLFRPDTIERMIRHFQVLLEGIVADPDRPLSRLPLVDAAEQRQVLEQWNDTASEFDRGRCVPQLFEAHAEQSPETPAVVAGGRAWSYGELNRRANQLARYLQRQGVEPEVRVGICLERSPELVLAVLGVLKAGGAYVPLDVAYTQDARERTRFVLQDAQVSLVLTQSDLAASLDECGAQRLLVDGEAAQQIGAERDDNVAGGAGAEQLAYVLYTSGSTGRPKGVMVTHGNLLNAYYGWEQAYRLGSEVRAHLQMASFGFDVFAGDLVRALGSGGKLVICPKEVLLDPAELLQLMRQEQVDAAEFVPVVLRTLVQHLEQTDQSLDFMRLVVVGSDAWFVGDHQRTRRMLGPATRLINSYGLTETTIDSSYFEGEAEASPSGLVPIGRPFPNVRLYVLDAGRQPVPIGVPGELYIGGQGVARGYVNAELNAARYLPDPFVSEPGALLCRTGDRARWRADGQVEFLGRADDQVKIRGFRIEPGEVEQVLREHPQLAEAAVVVRERAPGEPRLVAYTAARAGSGPSLADLRQFLRQRLAEYLIPSLFVSVPALPVTSSGKVDRRALPAPDWSVVQRDGEYVAPRTDDEARLAEIWQAVLRVAQVGVQDNFFVLGGHSLLATQVMSRIARELHVELPLRELFLRPTIAELAERILVVRSQGGASCGEPIPVASRDGELLASFAQEALWIVDQLDPGSAVYNMPLALRLSGGLDVNALNLALNEVVARHESLRTKMGVRDGRPIQVIEAIRPLELAIVDLQHLEPAGREAAALARVAAEAGRPFRLDEGPLFRVSLQRLSPDEHVLVLVMHHIISDDWSMGVLFADFVSLYQAFTAGLPSPLPSLPIQYADYAMWQRQRLAGENLQRLQDYWCPRLEGVPPLDLPTDRPRSLESTSAGGTIDTVLPAGLTAHLKELGSREGATLYMTLLAAFEVLLYRYSGQEDFGIGSPIANRLRPEIETLIGYFINVVVLRADLAGDPTFRGLLGRVKQTSLEAFEHQELPFERVVEAVNPVRDAGRHPLFQVMFALQNAPRPEVALGDLAVAEIPLDEDTSKFELSFTAWEENDGLTLSVEYDSHLFRPDTIERMIRHFQVLLEGIVADPDRPLSRLPLVDAAEQRQVLEQWNDTASEFDRGRCVPQLFEAHAEQSPETPAVVAGGRAWSYGELNRRANQLARYLQRQGVEPEVRVGICLERSPELVLAVLGVLKAGGAYVPLDVAYTQDARERTRFVLQDAQVSLVLTQSDLAASLDECGAQRLLLDGEAAQQIGAESGDNVAGGAGADQLAYVLYTSGSTGRPKGVMVTHGNLLNAYYGWEQAYRLGSDVRTHLQMASFGFDVFAGDLVRALGSGGKLVICPKEVLLDPAELLPLMRQEQVDGAEFVPVVLRTLVQYLEQTDQSLDFMRLVVVGSDAWFVGDHQRTRRMLGPETRLINSYGLTETTIDSSYFEGEAEASPSGLVPIGRPFPNVRLYVLDAGRQPVPIGVPGELYIGGLGVARGYVNAELNAARYFPDPFVSEPGALLCRTGDRARWRADGQVEFLGRADDQVKIRGFRIEPGEVEQVLREHPQLAEAAVVVRERAPSEPRLVAYTAAREGSGPSVTDLRQFLRQRLAEYLIPSLFVSVPALPVTSSGKVDRRALPAPDWSVVQRDGEYVAPRTDDEARLAEIWQAVLRVAQVGVQDNFFVLGGHSLLATQVMSRIARELHVELPLRELFLRPTIAELAERILVVRSQGGACCGEPIPVASRDGELLASFAQEALWIVDQLDPGSAVYNMPLALRLSGGLDVNALNLALNEVVARHESLRTKMGVRDGRPIQVIEAIRPLELAIVDLQHLEPAGREAAALARVAAEAGRPFRLDEGPLFRVSLQRLSPDEHVLVLVMHHIISDDWSMGVLFADFVSLYQAFTAGLPSPLPSLPIQYADYAMWQRQRLAGENLQRLQDYWCPRLEGVPPLDLPTDRPRSLESTSAGGTIDTVLPAGLTAHLKELGSREGATLYMTLLAAFEVLLYRYSGQEDFGIGSPIANRLRPEIETLIGYFINVVVLRADLAGDPTFRGLLGRVKQTSLEAFEHQELPFERVVEAVNPVRDAGRHPLFQVMFALQNAPRPEVALGDLAVAEIPLDEDTSKFELSFTAWEENDGLTLSVEYDSHLFRPDTIERMIRHFQVLLEGIVADPDRPLSRLPLVDAAEQRQVLEQWNDTASEFDRGRCVPQLFEAHAERSPETPAVVAGGRAWSYGELNRRANQLARYLQRQGVEPEVRVGICLERSPELVLAVLGVLKAGGAYVPLDVAYTQDARERTRFVLQDAQVSLVLTQSDLAASLDECGAQRLLLDGAAAQQIGVESGDNVAAGAGAEQLAYVLYTSGSTGRPKGVMVTHGNLLNAYYGWEQAYRLGSEVRAHLQMASFGFDVFAGDLVRALGSGGKLVICPKEVLLDPAELLQLMRQEQVDAAEFVPVVLRTLVQHLEQTDQSLDFMRLVVVGSDAWFVGDHQRARRVLGPATRLINSYGLTETTIDSSYFEGEAEASLSGLVPIGRPFPNVRLYVLDAGRQPVPIGVPGELYIGGLGVARGYVNAELNAARYLPDPFVSERGALLCRTGDRARWRADGQVEFLGRADDQVKIRGFRIEPGEVEQVLREHPLLAEAAVVVRERAPGEPRLVAYTAAREGSGPSVAELRQFLRQRLAEYLLPSLFVSLPALPVTSSGKVDRRALPAPDWSVVQRDGEYVAPRTDDEARLAEIWQAVLRVGQVGVQDNFFVLGGHSLLATQVMSRIARELHVELPLRELFLRPTIAELARRIATLRTTGSVADLPPIQPVPRDAPLPASYGQEAFWIIDRLQEGPSPYLTFPAARIRGALNVPAFERALNEVLRRHESLRTTFAEREGRPVQVIAPHTPQPLTVVDLSELPSEERDAEVRRYAAAQSRQAIDLSVGPLARVELLRLSADEHVVLVSMHHIIYDGWSLAVLDDELFTTYRAFAAGLPSPLPELPIQYADYAVWQRERLQGEVLEQLRRYWLKQLADLPTLELPTDRPRPPVRTSEGATCRRQLSGPLSQGVRRLSQAEGVTTFMTLLAVFQTLLHRYSGQDDFPIGTPAAGRLRPETENLIGYFVNTLVLRANLSDDPVFRELLGRVRETALEAFEHQELPFERLVQELNPARDASRHPVFQVMLILQNAPNAFREAQALTELELCELEADSRELASDFDLAMMVSENEQCLELSLGYRTDLFDATTIERMLQHFQTLLEQVVAEPERRVSKLALLSPDERHQMLVEWNRTEAEYPRDACLADRFERQAERTPDAVAAICEGREMTYRELNEHANRLAHWLRKRGVGPDRLVALHLERSHNVLVGMLGILKAGGAFLPLDAELPPERLAFMLADAEVPVIVTQRSLAGIAVDQEAAAGGVRPSVICLDTDGKMLAEEDSENLPRLTTSRNLAYAIYTSGSTGRPKGVMIEHHSVVNVVTSFIRSYTVGPADRVLQSASISFDVSVNEIFPALSTGATVVLPNKHERLDLDGLGQFVRRNGVTIMAAAPTALARLNKLPDPLPGVRLVLSGGEALSFGEVDHLRELATVVNGYGPTEATICATSFALVRQAADAQATVPIGKPLANYQVYVVDRYSDCAAIGCAGELCIGGVGLARGYLHDEELTSRKFVPNPFCPGERMYRTGDRVRWLPDGNLEFLGRMDRQVKIRGYRIELGELEAILTKHPAIEKAAVLDRQAGPGDRRLVAYVVLAQRETGSGGRDQSDLLADIKSYLADKVPNYMLPAAFVRLDSLPLTSSGKVDLKSLPEPSFAAIESRTEYVAPRTPLEEQLAAAWRDVLGLECVGVHDDFFELGGHSLLAVQLMARVRGASITDLPIASLFAAPTIAALAERIEAGTEGTHGDAGEGGLLVRELAASLVQPPRADAASLVPLRAGGTARPLFCLPGLGGHVATFLQLAHGLADHRPVYGLQAQGLDPGQQPHDRIEAMADFYLREIRAVQPCGPYLLVGWSMGGLIALEAAHQLAAVGERVSLLAMLDTYLSVPDPAQLDPDEQSVVSWIAPYVNLSATELRKLPLDQQWERIAEQAQLVKGAGVAAIRRLADVCRAHLTANARYEPRPYEGRAVLFQASAEHEALDPRWQTLCPQLQAEMLPGNHYSMMRKPHVGVLAERLDRYLSEAMNADAPGRTS